MENNVDSILGNTSSQISSQSVDDILGNNTDPTNINSARSLSGNVDDNGMCQRFVEKTTLGKTGLFPTADSAWQTYLNNGKGTTNLDLARPGDLVYFQPDVSNEQDGHVGILTGDGNFISATDNGVQEIPISQWQQETKQQIAGIVPLSALRGTN